MKSSNVADDDEKNASRLAAASLLNATQEDNSNAGTHSENSQQEATQQTASASGNIDQQQHQQQQQQHDEDIKAATAAYIGKDQTRNALVPIDTAPSRAVMPGAVAVGGTASTTRASITVQDDVKGVESNRQAEETPSVLANDAVATLPAGTSPDELDDVDSSDVHESRNNVNSTEEIRTSAPMVEAELIAPPVHAYHVHQVHIDEDSRNFVAPLEIEASSPDTDDLEAKMKKQRKSKRNKRIIKAVLLVIIAIGIIVAVAVRGFGGDEVSSSESASYPYPCFTSTYDIFIAQLDHDPSLPDENQYIICPDTRIPIGTFENPAKQQYDIVDGDYPLIVSRENVTVQCGLDGSRHNNCVIDGGFVQMLLDGRFPTRDGTLVEFTSLDNMVIRGITFTGLIQDSGPFLSMSITMGHPGRNIRFEDCEWKSITVNHGLIALYRNLFQITTGVSLEDQSMDVTFDGCSFRDIVYDAAVFYSESHNLTLTNCTFENIELSSLHRTECQISHPKEKWGYYFDEGCAGLMYCAVGAHCRIEDVCIFDMEWYGMSLMFGSNETTFGVDETYWGNYDFNSTDDSCELALASGYDLADYDCVDVFSRTEPYPSSCQRVKGFLPFERA